jgi:hypothetical protein
MVYVTLLLPPTHADTPGQDIDLDDVRTQVRLLSLMGSPATVVAAAAAKDADTVREYLTRNPQDVRQSKNYDVRSNCEATDDLYQKLHKS